MKSLDVSIFEHLIDMKLQTITQRVIHHQKAEVLFNCLMESPDEDVLDFFTTIGGLYPELFLNIMGRKVGDVDSGKSIVITVSCHLDILT